MMAGGNISIDNIHVLLSDVERSLLHRYTIPSPINDIKTFPLVSKSGKNALICEIVKKGEGDSCILLFNWYILHEPYWDIRRREVETNTISSCIINMFLARVFSSWMVCIAWQKRLSTLVEWLRNILESLDSVLAIFDNLVERYGISMGEHSSCYLGCVSFLHSKIDYSLRYGRPLKQLSSGEIKGIFSGEIYMTRAKRKLSLGIDFGITNTEVKYELFVRGSPDPFMRYVDAMIVEDDL
jgi:hypothetical protein